MARYFLEVSYNGARFSGFQKQENANTIQQEIEHAFLVLQKEPAFLTGSSRTDAGVHALQNYFHFDFESPLHLQFVYKMNAILPPDVVLKKVLVMPATAHSRFDAESRVYHYQLYAQKDPFLRDRAYFFPYKIDLDRMQEAAEIILAKTDFSAFSKRNTQVKTMICAVSESRWIEHEHMLKYEVRANRFLRGMVRGLTGTMLQVGRGKLSLESFEEIIESKDPSRVHFDVPAHGLFLKNVNFPKGYFDNQS